MKPAWLKVAMAAGTIGSAVVGGLAAGPPGALAAGLTAAVGVLGGLYHEPPKRRPKRDARGQIADEENPK